MPVMTLTENAPVPPDFRNTCGTVTGELITPRGGLYDLSGCVDIGGNVGANDTAAPRRRWSLSRGLQFSVITAMYHLHGA